MNTSWWRGGLSTPKNLWVRHYHPQVAMYKDVLEGRLPGGKGVASYGLWFVREGRVVRWAP
jgi:hypothetical protein